MRRAQLAALFLFLISAAAEDDGYDLVPGTLGAVRLTKRVSVSLTVVPHRNHFLLPDGPVLVRLSGQGIRLERTLFHREEAVDPRAEAPRFELSFVAVQTGPAHLDASCTFYLCQEKRCRPVETDAHWSFNIEP